MPEYNPIHGSVLLLLAGYNTVTLQSTTNSRDNNVTHCLELELDFTFNANLNMAILNVKVGFTQESMEVSDRTVQSSAPPGFWDVLPNT